MKEGDGNGSTGEKEEGKTREKMVGQSEGWYQREGTVGGGSVRPSHMEVYVILDRPDIQVWD